MALKKQKEVKGYIAEYWKITDIKLDLITSTLGAELALFKDKITRDDGKQNVLLREIFRWTIPEEFNNVAAMTVTQMVAFVYARMKESDIELVPIVDEYGVPVLDEYGVQTYDEVEQNWFVDAEDIFETPS